MGAPSPQPSPPRGRTHPSRRPRARLRLSLAVAALGLLYGRPAAAQFDISYSDPIQFPQPTASHFLAGFIDHPGTTVRVTPRGGLNNAWRLLVRTRDASLGGPAGYAKPFSDVLWRVEGSTVWQPLTGTNTQVFTGNGAQTVTVYFRVLLNWARDRPESALVPFRYEGAITWRAEY